MEKLVPADVTRIRRTLFITMADFMKQWNGHTQQEAVWIGTVIDSQQW